MTRALPLLAIVLVAPAVQAQAPRALNAPPVPSVDAERLRAFQASLGRGGPTPDTTAPWRYYPLHVGDAWEYEDFLNGRVTRREVEGDTLLNGRRYFNVRQALFETDGTLIGEQVHTLRFDTTSSQVLQFTLSGDVSYYLALCPFDVPFESYVECDDLPFYVEGGYDGVLVFETGGEPDTLRGLSVKRYLHTLGAGFFSFVGGFGLVLQGGKGPDNYALYYARIEGVEYGEPRYPTATEPAPSPAHSPSRRRTRTRRGGASRSPSC